MNNPKVANFWKFDVGLSNDGHIHICAHIWTSIHMSTWFNFLDPCKCREFRKKRLVSPGTSCAPCAAQVPNTRVCTFACFNHDVAYGPGLLLLVLCACSVINTWLLLLLLLLILVSLVQGKGCWEASEGLPASTCLRTLHLKALLPTVSVCTAACCSHQAHHFPAGTCQSHATQQLCTPCIHESPEAKSKIKSTSAATWQYLEYVPEECISV